MQSLAVFCGAKHGHRAAYTQAAVALGRSLAQQGITLVYGGGNIGLMGEVATAALNAGGRVVGVIPAFMVERELAHAGLSELIVVDSMHSRKAKMAEQGAAERATGYIVGGISPLAQKKALPTVIDETAQLYDRIHVSAGRRGLEIALAPDDLRMLTQGVFAAVAR